MSVREHLVKVYECGVCGQTFATEAGAYSCARVHAAHFDIFRSAEDLPEPEFMAARPALVERLRAAVSSRCRPLHDDGRGAVALYEPAPERVS